MSMSESNYCKDCKRLKDIACTCGMTFAHVRVLRRREDRRVQLGQVVLVHLGRLVRRKVLELDFLLLRLDAIYLI